MGFHALILYSKKTQNNIVELLFCIWGVSAENKNESRAQLIDEIEIGLLLELDWYSNGLIFSGTLLIPYLNDNKSLRRVVLPKLN